MSTGLILFLVFMALSILDSVARARRSKQVAPPPEEDEEWRAEQSSAQVEGYEDEAPEMEPWEMESRGGLEELLGLETAPAAPPATTPEVGAESPWERESRAAAREHGLSHGEAGRAGRTPDQERRRGEAMRSSPVEQPSGAEGWRSRVERGLPEGDRRLPNMEETGSRPAHVARQTAPLQDSSVGGARRALKPIPASAERHTPRGTRLYRDLFAVDSLRRAFVLKEILDPPVSERRERRDAR